MKRLLPTLAIAMLTFLSSVDLTYAQERGGQGGEGGRGGDGGQAGQDDSANRFSRRRSEGRGESGEAGQDGDGGRGGAGGRGGGPMPGPSPLVAALDENADGEISSSEIESAVDSLKSLDRNSDGKLTEDEIRPCGPAPRGEGPEGPGPGPDGVPPGPEGRGPGPGEFIARLMEADQNKDGKISKEEAPERMQNTFDRLDGDGDGFLVEEEIRRMADRRREGGPDGPAGRGGGGPGGPGGGFGSPEAFVDRLFQLDANGDGNLTREELSKMAEQMGGRRGDRPEGGDGEGRPRRPQRPGGNQEN